LQQEWLQSFAAARTAFEVAPPEKLEMEVQGWPQLSRFLGDTTIHYGEHEHHIRTWLKQLETTGEHEHHIRTWLKQLETTEE